MATEKLKAQVNTVIKQSTIDSSRITDPNQKFFLDAGNVLEINSYKSAANNHWELELTSPINDVTKWFAYIPHVTIIHSPSTTESVLEEIRNNTQFNVYRQPTEQDGVGLGIPPNGQDNRSERICPVFVLSPRRQTDYLVRQLVKLCPVKDTAFIIAERFVQYPEDYLPNISHFEKAVLVQSFVGIGSNSFYPQWAKTRHNKELWRLEQSIRLLQSINRKIVAVVCAMGDSPSQVAESVRSQVQEKLYSMLDQYDLSEMKQEISWGADELIAMAIAQTLPPNKIRIRIANDDTQLHYDGKRRPSEVVKGKLSAIGLEESENNWDFEVAILTRRRGGVVNNYQKNDQQQAALDKEFLAPYMNYSSEQRSKLAIVDGRLFNGAWNADSVLPYCDLLAFGSWGTFGNCFGSTLAMAKILFHANNSIAQKQLYLEAVAHDVFANGYKEAQRNEEPNSFHNQLERETNITFNHYEGYPDPVTTGKVFEKLNQYVNRRMKQHFVATSCVQNRSFRITPQLWRTFESEVHIWPRLIDEVHRVGIYRTDLDVLAFNPSFSEGLA